MSASKIEFSGCVKALVTSNARKYSVYQLAIRGGVSREWLRSWNIEVGWDETVVYPIADQPKCCIRFPHSSSEHWDAVRGGRIAVGTAEVPHGWTQEQGRLDGLVVPFADREHLGPLFRVDGTEARCSVDLLTSLILTLSRYEETIPGPRDRHGRFPATASLAQKHGFRERPIVDEWGLTFRQVLKRLVPRWQPEKQNFRVHLTHDVDEIGLPPRLRKFAKTAIRGGIGPATLDALSLFGGRPAALASVLDTVGVAARHGLGCAVYWKGSPPSEFDNGYNIEDRRVLEVIEALQVGGVELGVHPGYRTYLDSAALQEEVERVRRAFRSALTFGGRQHFLRWSPQMWNEWEKCGLAYDSSVGYSECIGFRAGTCYPYRPFLIAEDREAALFEVPLIAMDCALTGAMGMRGEACLEALSKVIEACRNVGGVFTMLWHTDSILEPVYGDIYERVVRTLAGTAQFDWRTETVNNARVDERFRRFTTS